MEETLSTKLVEHSLNKRGQARMKTAELAEREKNYPMTGVEMADRMENDHREKLKGEIARLTLEADTAKNGENLGAFVDDVKWRMENRAIFDEAAAAHRVVNLGQ
jgi:hypothetical protein